MEVQQLLNSIASDAKRGMRQSVKEKVIGLINADAMLGKNWLGIANICRSVGETKLAVEAYRRFANVENTDEARIQFAGMLAEFADLNDALKELDKVEESFSSLHLKGVCFSQLGEFDDAIKAFNKAVEKHPLSGPTWLSLIAIDRPGQHVEKLLSLQTKFESGDKFALVQYYFALTKAYEQLKDNELTLKYAQKANELMSSDFVKGTSNNENLVDKLIFNFDQEFFNTFPSIETAPEDPVFILGLPRSGTTLIEQIISDQTNKLAIGEAGFNTPSLRPINLFDVNSEATKNVEQSQKKNLLSHFYREYKRALSDLDFNATNGWVDKSIDNTWYVGLLAKAFPKAKFVVIDRENIDIAWSCYKNFFKSGVDWSYSVQAIVEKIQSEKRLMQHWQDCLTDRIYTVSYEQLVNNKEQELDNLCQFLSVDYNDKARNEHNKAIKTLSLKQARAPIHNSSVGVSKEIHSLFKDLL